MLFPMLFRARLCTIFPRLLLLTVPLYLAGCQRTPAPASSSQDSQTSAAPSVAAADAADESDEAHPHVAGAHGGTIIPVGSDSYHAEAIVDSGGSLRLLMLQRDETRILEVETQSLTAWVKVTGQTDAAAIPMTALPQEGDTAGLTSQFVAELPQNLRSKPLDVTIPNVRIDGERFRIGFSTNVPRHNAEMPSSLPAEEEQQLYLTAAGSYTEKDILANGKITAAEKFAGKISKHDAKPQPGDRICPISRTKANPEFTWIINGQPYQFCCPPCIDEYVRLAKQQPAELLPPESFIKQP